MQGQSGSGKQAVAMASCGIEFYLLAMSESEHLSLNCLCGTHLQEAEFEQAASRAQGAAAPTQAFHKLLERPSPPGPALRGASTPLAPALAG